MGRGRGGVFILRQNDPLTPEAALSALLLRAPSDLGREVPGVASRAGPVEEDGLREELWRASTDGSTGARSTRDPAPFETSSDRWEGL